jgi:signal transduction histidine kinase
LAADGGTPVRLSVDGERHPLPPGHELGVFRVIQEAVTNARKHARATLIDIALRFEPRTEAPEHGTLTVTVRDNGIGFDVDNLRRIYPTLQKMGLLSMEERVKAIGGTLEIVSMPGGGTRVSVRVPW